MNKSNQIAALEMRFTEVTETLTIIEEIRGLVLIRREVRELRKQVKSQKKENLQLA